MAEEQKAKVAEAAQNSPEIKWISREALPDIYANLVHVNWTPFDLRVRFGQLITDPAVSPTKAGWVVNEQCAITMSYGQAKYLRNLLHGIIKDYEAKNGEIKITPEMPTPTTPEEPK
ncbi:MAG TPA: DUF3467 domain-containing protein [Terriglobales bacterium]|nr:DUF3467 domain-containing protein [Terriglobales bacterium]